MVAVLPPHRQLTSSDNRHGSKHTIDDVARTAGVSKATVSRFLNPGDKQLSPEIAQRVETAIRQLDYRPSPMAQGLKRGRSRLVGLVVADVTNPFSVAVLQGAERACREAGYMLMLFHIGKDEGRERDAIQALSSYQVEGFLLHTLGRDGAALAEATRHGKPVVLIDRRAGDGQADLVGLDNPTAVQCCVDHLRERGYREVLYVSETTRGVSSRVERLTAFRNAMPEHGKTLELDGDQTESLDRSLRQLRRRAGGKGAAVVCANAVITLRVVAAATRLGLALGTELGLVGFDETEWAPWVGPGLSTIAQPTDDIGRGAARCLIERLHGLQMPPRQILLPGTLLPRGSTQRR